MEQARALAQQLAATIRDERVLAAVAAVDRARYVPAELRERAFEDEALPIAGGQRISQPTVVARMLELLTLSGSEHVLDVGTGSGYHAALLARLTRKVVSIERDRELSDAARRRLEHDAIHNVTCLVADGWHGPPGERRYDAINVAACPGPEVPAALVRRLADGGRLVIPLADPDHEAEDPEPPQILTRLTRRGDRVHRETFERVRFVPLISPPADRPDDGG